MMRTNQRQEKVKNIGFSLVSKLNIQLWLRLFNVFLFLNVVYCVAVVIGTIYYAENTLAASLYTESPSYWSEMNGITVLPLTEPVSGWKVPDPLSRLFPEETADAARYIGWDTAPGISWWTILASFTYNLEFSDLGLRYSLRLETLFSCLLLY